MLVDRRAAIRTAAMQPAVTICKACGTSGPRLLQQLFGDGDGQLAFEADRLELEMQKAQVWLTKAVAAGVREEELRPVEATLRQACTRAREMRRQRRAAEDMGRSWVLTVEGINWYVAGHAAACSRLRHDLKEEVMALQDSVSGIEPCLNQLCCPRR